MIFWASWRSSSVLGLSVESSSAGEPVVSFHFIGLEHQALAGKTVFECVHGRTLFAFGRLRTSGPFGVGSVDFVADFFTHVVYRFYSSSRNWGW